MFFRDMRGNPTLRELVTHFQKRCVPFRNNHFLTFFDVDKNKPVAVDRIRNVATNFFATLDPPLTEIRYFR